MKIKFLGNNNKFEICTLGLSLKFPIAFCFSFVSNRNVYVITVKSNQSFKGSRMYDL